MIFFEKTDSNKCLICNNENKGVNIFDMSINRTIRNNANIITFAICNECIGNMSEYIKSHIISTELYDWQQVEGGIVEVDFLTALESNRLIKPVENDPFVRHNPYIGGGKDYLYPCTWLLLLSTYDEDEKTAKNHKNMMRLINGKWLIKPD